METNELIAAAEQVLPLIIANRTKLEPRLAAGFIDGVQTDLRALREASDGTAPARAASRAATVSQNDAAKQGAALVANLRALVRTGAPKDKALWRAYGVGAALTNTVSSVQKALSTVVSAAASNADKTRAVGILGTDIDAARTLLAALSTLDGDQERKRTSSKLATSAAGAIRARLAANLAHLKSIARSALPADKAEAIADLMPSSGRGSPAKGKPARGQAAAPA